MPGKHRKIRFSKRKVKDLNLYPSSASPDGIKLRAPIYYRSILLRLMKRIIYLCLALFTLIGIIGFILLKVGISGDVLATKMQTAFRAELGRFAEAHINHARLSLDENFHIALEAQNVLLENIKGGVEINHIGVLRLGLRTRSLIHGDIKIAQLELQDADIRLPRSQGGSFLDRLPKDDKGRIDFDTVSQLIFTVFDGLLAGFDNQSTRSLVFANISLHFDVKGEDRVFIIDRLYVDNFRSRMVISGEMEWEGKTLTLEGEVGHENRALADSFSIITSNIPLHLGAPDDASPFLPDGRVNNGFFRVVGSGNLQLAGTRASQETKQKIGLLFNVLEAKTQIGADDDIDTKLSISAEYVTGSGKIEILPSRIIAGGVQMPINGAFGPVPTEDLGEGPSDRYRFEFVSNGAASAPKDSPEPRLDFALRLAGDYAVQQRRASFSDFTVRVPSGSMMGQGNLQFADEGSPETIMVLRIPKMSVSHAKQLWPINVSPGARRWVLSHIFGGEMRDATFEIALPAGFIKSGKAPSLLTEKELRITGKIQGVRSDLVGELPAIRNAFTHIDIKGTRTEVDIERAVAYVDDNTLNVSDGRVVIPWVPMKTVVIDIAARISGEFTPIGKVLGLQPINAADKLPFAPEDASGDISGLINLKFPLGKKVHRDQIDWQADIDFHNFDLAQPYEGAIRVANGAGQASVSKEGVVLEATALLNDIPASVQVTQPMAGSSLEKKEKIQLKLSDDVRKKLMPSLNMFLSGMVPVDVGPSVNGERHLVADLSNAAVEVPWVGWKKGAGVSAKAELTINASADGFKNLNINDFSLKGDTFRIEGKLNVQNGELASADFSHANLNRDDDIRLTIRKANRNYKITASGRNYDMRPVIKLSSNQHAAGNSGSIKDTFDINANFDQVLGFYDEKLSNFKAGYTRDNSGNEDIMVSAFSARKGRVDVQVGTQAGNMRSVRVIGTDAGALLRFMNYYDKLYGGVINASLQTGGDGALSGPVKLDNFQIINEPKLASIVSSSPPSGGQSLNQAVKGKIDSSRVVFDNAFGHIAKGDNFLVLDKGVVRGPSVGATFQGIIYDSAGNMSMTGTFMPAYGLNRLFGDVPVLGAVLGNGRDGGLFGITFKIEGNAKQPRVTVNPISAIAPGIFRQIFEFQQ